jgi:hypothetical protein
MDSGQEARLVAFVLERSADSVVSRARSRRPRANDGGNTERQINFVAGCHEIRRAALCHEIRDHCVSGQSGAFSPSILKSRSRLGISRRRSHDFRAGRRGRRAGAIRIHPRIPRWASVMVEERLKLRHPRMALRVVASRVLLRRRIESRGQDKLYVIPRCWRVSRPSRFRPKRPASSCADPVSNRRSCFCTAFQRLT